MLLDEEKKIEEMNLWENRLVKTCNKCMGTGCLPFDGVFKTCECRIKARMNTYLVSRGLPRKYLGDEWTWDKVEQRSFVTKCKSYADDFIKNYYDGKGLYIYGNQGRGKSTMEVLIAKDVVMKVNPDNNRNFQVAFFIYDDLVKMSYNSNNSYILEDLINHTQLLIIDNIGSETGLNTEKRSSVVLLENILRKRDNAKFPTIISSNFHPYELSKVYSDVVQDFIKQNCFIIDVSGNNHRKKNDDIDL